MSNRPDAEFQQSRIDADWPRCERYVHNDRPDSHVLYVLASGLGGTIDTFEGLKALVHQRSSGHIVDFWSRHAGSDLQVIADYRADVIREIAHGRPTAFIGNSAGSDLNALTAVKMIEKWDPSDPSELRFPVAAMWLDAPFLAGDDNFARSATKAVRGAFHEQLRGRAIRRGVQFYVGEPIQAQRESHLFQKINDVGPIRQLSTWGVPIMITHGAQDELVGAATIRRVIAACEGNAPVLAFELRTGHQEMGGFGREMRFITTNFVQTVDEITLKGLSISDSYDAFERLGHEIYYHQRGRGVHIEAFDGNVKAFGEPSTGRPIIEREPVAQRVELDTYAGPVLEFGM